MAGGQARRMQGQDKGLLFVAGQPLAAWTLSRLVPQTATVLINANRHREQYAAFGTVVADKIGGFCGPLAGIHAGLSAATTAWALTAPCDSPFLPTNLAQQMMHTAQQTAADIVIATADNRPQPVFMLAKTSMADSIADFIANGERKIDRWYSQHSHAFANFTDADAFVNINTPEELAAAELRLQHSSLPPHS